MPRYFIEVAYKGTNYSGSQEQKNANSIQAEVEKALGIFFRRPFNLTGASRTDAGVHALQNFFHFDMEDVSKGLAGREELAAAVYRLNAIVPVDICVSNLMAVNETAHCRYDALEREYRYFIYRKKNPFLRDRAYFFPYKLQWVNLEAAAAIINNRNDFTSFSKRRAQVNNFFCTVNTSFWAEENDMLVYTVSGNRFLRGMVRGLVGTMLKFGRGLINREQFGNIFDACDPARADFSAPAHGLFLNHIKYPPELFL